ncbi:chitinase [Allonocardiopsis opalescens]|uniref:chitinase n=1 Tax=Allonocardiopsis opalescens TaxID=1144618 RepID=A0A2T0QA00_9ACTN|nr:glycoside hydrolase family 18 protein [Allonocardiopsis opalescens]PRY00673.1 chitinase [Allonocardiopsis opalescens]
MHVEPPPSGPPSHRPSWPRRAAAGLLAVLGALAMALLPASPAAAVNVVTDSGFESGGLGAWSCSGQHALVTSPVHAGSRALSGTPAGQDTARCQRTVTVQPNSPYRLSAWVRGNYTFLGADGVAGGSTSTWASSPNAWTQLTLNVTSGASGRVTIFAHGWHGQGAYYLDDVVLDGDPVGGGEEQPPASPGGLTVTGTTASSVSLRWNAAGGDPDGYRVYRNGTLVATVPGTSHTVTGLAGQTAYRFSVAAYNGAGESARSAEVTATTGTGGGNNSGTLPNPHLTGYWQNFVNGAEPQRLSDVHDNYDVIVVAFADQVAGQPGAVTFNLDPALSSALGGYTRQQFIADIAQAQAEGKHVILSIGGELGNVDFGQPTSVANFVNSFHGLMQEYGFDGLDIDLEHGMNGTNVAEAARQLAARAGDDFVLTMAPQTIEFQFDGPYMQLVEEIPHLIDAVHTQYYNSGSMNGCDGRVYSQGGVEFIAAQACILLQHLEPHQVSLGVPASSRAAGSGYVDATVVNRALDCLTRGTSCGSFTPPRTWPGLGGAMTWSTNWDGLNGDRFATVVGGHLDTLP